MITVCSAMVNHSSTGRAERTALRAKKKGPRIGEHPGLPKPWVLYKKEEKKRFALIESVSQVVL
jgi:hypothetical protein